MQHPLQIESIHLDNIIIDKLAQPAYLFQKLKTPLICPKKLKVNINEICLQYTFPFAYLDKQGSYNVFANWHCLSEAMHTEKKMIQVCLFETPPKNIERAAWSYVWSLVSQSIHPNQAIRFVFEAVERCPQKIAKSLLNVGAKNETKSLTSYLCGVGIQRSKTIALDNKGLDYATLRALK